MFKKIRTYINQKRWLFRFLLIGVILGMIGLIMPQVIRVLDPVIPQEQKTGTVTRIQPPQTHYESLTYVFITLDDGTPIKVDGTMMTNVKEGNRVIVQQFRSKIFRLIHYEFVQYEQTQHD